MGEPVHLSACALTSFRISTTTGSPQVEHLWPRSIGSIKNAYLIQYGVWRVTPFLATFKDYPPSQRPASFSIDQAVDTLMKSIGTK